ncbi:DNA polymerase III subunit delta [Sphingobium sp. SCG-1]|uniref:DNA polymerase III subunit delta n=1 Tax=Sphingobium sp. SCG-1 TaxID=2072936 RepID=UPI000CD6BB1B|nr:DNA polymerase III subunit delta [Sphingobium sp. SCG-1]AUW56959.1 DNA polymerase III subunit delta [Sphingobium sp. SCG-1]
MKANKGQIERALDAPPADIRLFFLYGPDESGSIALSKRLERAMGANAQRIDLDGATLKNDPARLSDEAASISMFGDKQWIRVTPLGDEALPAIEALLQAEHAGNPVVAIAGALKGTSKLVKLALDHKATMACISYTPEGRDADQIAIGIARELGLRLPPDLARRITELTGGDRALMAGEVDKLALFLDAAPEHPVEATAEALNALSAESFEEDVGPLVNAVLGGDLKAMHSELAGLRVMGTNMGTILRPLQNRAMLLANIRAEFDVSGRLDAAIESAGKAVFWKDKATVTRQVKLWDANGIARVISRLGAAERASRSSRNAGDIMVTHELLTIARQAARERAA